MFIVSNLTVSLHNGDRLLGPLHFEMAPGTVTLLVGATGSGKTTIGLILAGLHRILGRGWSVSGTISANGVSRELCDARPLKAGLVFQSGALFGDMSVAHNLAIAVDYGTHGTLGASFSTLLSGIDPQGKPAELSGGQRQRVAIARTLLSGDALLILDEPNSALDVPRSRELAHLLRDLCNNTGRTALVIAHHVGELTPVADQALLLDRTSKTLLSIPPDRDAIERALQEEEKRFAKPVATSAQPVALQSSTRVRWFVHYLCYYSAVLFFSASALLYAGLGAATLGFVAIWFIFNHLPFRLQLETLLHDELLAGMGFALSRVLVPLLLCVMLAARSGALIAADLGYRSLDGQTLAMRNMHIPFRWNILTPICIANTFAFIACSLVFFAVSVQCAHVTWRFLFSDDGSWRFFSSFLDQVPGFGATLFPALFWLLAKLAGSGAATAAVAIHCGLSRMVSVRDVNDAVARAIIGGVAATLLIHTFVALAEFAP